MELGGVFFVNYHIPFLEMEVEVVFKKLHPSARNAGMSDDFKYYIAAFEIRLERVVIIIIPIPHIINRKVFL